MVAGRQPACFGRAGWLAGLPTQQRRAVAARHTHTHTQTREVEEEEERAPRPARASKVRSRPNEEPPPPLCARMYVSQLLLVSQGGREGENSSSTRPGERVRAPRTQVRVLRDGRRLRGRNYRNLHGVRGRDPAISLTPSRVYIHMWVCM